MLSQVAHRGPDGAVVEQPQVPVSVLGEQRVRVLDLDQATEEVGVDAVVVPRRVVLDPSGVGLEEEVGYPGVVDLLRDRALAVGSHFSRKGGQLPVDHHRAAGLEDVRGLADQPRVLHHLGLATPRLEHDLDPRPVAGLQRARLQQRELTLGVAEQRPAAPEQGAVEIRVNAAESHGATVAGWLPPARHRRMCGRRRGGSAMELSSSPDRSPRESST
jgi:hypothetical protein